MNEKYFLEHKGPFNGLLAKIESEGVYQLVYSCDGALCFDHRYEAVNF